MDSLAPSVDADTRGCEERMTIRDAVYEILADVAETDDVRERPDLDLFGARVLDSLQTVDLLARLSDTFSLSLSPADFDRAAWATPELIAAEVERRIGGGAR
jgi:D-alanine--poly(phosphoribitol) ligase subunit 2